MHDDASWLTPLRWLTDLADQAVVLPLVATVGTILLLAGVRRDAMAWIIAVPGALAFTLAAKLSVAACDARLPADLALHSPSGHTASAAAVCGATAVLLRPMSRPSLQALRWGLLAALVIGSSRLALGVHTLADVCAGAIIGVSGAFAMAQLACKAEVRSNPLPVLLVGSLGVLAMFYGSHWAVEPQIHSAPPLFWPLTLCRS